MRGPVYFRAMSIHVERCFVPEVQAPCGHNVFAHDGGVLLLPGMRGTEPGAAWWSEDGTRFVEAAIDGRAVGLGSEPVVDLINDHHWATQVTAAGHALFWLEGRLVRASVGPQVTFEPTAYRSPAEYRFKLQDVTVDAAGTWWVSGHASNDSLIGQVFAGPDGANWTPVPSSFEGSVLRLIRADGKIHALHYKHVTVVEQGGAKKLISMKDHIEHAIFTAAGVVGIGKDFVGVLPAGGKRSKYAAPPAGYGRYHIAAVPGGFVLGGLNGLWFAPDGLAWTPVPSFTGAVKAIVPSRAGMLVVSPRSEVHVVRGV